MLKYNIKQEIKQAKQQDQELENTLTTSEVIPYQSSTSQNSIAEFSKGSAK